ncbi:MAG TPA: hypothetical protein VMU34_08560 [Mycobacterium sp.]|nr:hypothetical protein [Mycobacterium sp.]
MPEAARYVEAACSLATGSSFGSEFPNIPYAVAVGALTTLPGVDDE